MASAQDEAFALVACRRGLLTPDAVARAQGQAQPSEPIANLLVQRRMLAAADASDVLRELARGTYACKRCGRALSYDALAALARLRCPACEGPLVPQSPPPTGRFPAAGAQRHPTGIIPAKAGWDLRETVIEKAQPKNEYRHAAETIREPASSAPTMSGGGQKMLGDYVVERELGRGSNGVVYLARRKGLERRFALKVLLEDFTNDEEGVKRFQLEAAIASKLQDSGIIGVYDVGRQGERYFYAMEYCPGPTLQEQLAQEGPMEPVDAAEMMLKLARTLGKAHEQGVLHRDLKPANIIIDERGRPRVTDFGLARDRSLSSSMTQEGDILGTPYYMSPEQLRGEKSINHRSDIYALGVILYECITGERPFKARTPMMLADLIVRGACPPPRQLDASIPKPLEAIVKTAMAVSPDDRFQTAGELATALDEYLQTERGSWLRRGRRRRRKKKRSSSQERGDAEGVNNSLKLALGLAVLLIVGTVAGLAVVLRQRKLRAARVARAEKTLKEVLGLPSQRSPVPVEEMRTRLEEIEPLAASDPDLSARVRHALQLTRGWAALEQARTLADSPSTWKQQEEALAVARHEGGDDALLAARLAVAERRLRASRLLAEALRRSSDPVAYRPEIVTAFEAVIREARDEPELAQRAELALIRYLLRRARYAEAEDRARSLERRTSADAATLLRILARHARVGDAATDAEARATLQRVWGKDPEGKVGLTAGALHLLVTKDAGGAAELARRACELDPKDPWPGRIRILALRALGRRDEASQQAEDLANLLPDDVGVLETVAGCRLAQHQEHRALVALERARRLAQPTPPKTLLRLYMQALLNSNQPEKAQDVGRAAVELYPGELALKILYGHAYLVGGDSRRAQRIFQAAYSEKPTEFEATARQLFQSGPALTKVLDLARGEPERRRDRPRRRDRRPPSDSDARVTATLMALVKQVPQAAQAPLKRALIKAAQGSPWAAFKADLAAAAAAAPRSPQLLTIRARLLVGRNVFDEGRKAIAAARAAVGAPEDELDFLEGRLLRYRGRRKEALEIFERLAKGTGPLAACARASAFLLQGKSREARQTLEASLAKQPEHLASRLLYPWILVGTGSRDKAAEALKALVGERGGLDGNLLTLGAILGLAQVVSLFKTDPMRAMMAGRQIMRSTEATLQLTEGAQARLMVCSFMLQQAMPFQGVINGWVRRRLDEARKLEPDRPVLEVLEGALALRADADPKVVLDHWAKAVKQGPLIHLKLWKQVFEKRYGKSERLDALTRH